MFSPESPPGISLLHVYIKNGIYFIIYFFKLTESGANIDVGSLRISVFEVSR